jgi:precorrin-2 dehydrogenase/sirohydrochlorin ferrochelatase
MGNLSAGSYFPILVDLTKFDIIVIGAGNIGKRKIENLLEFNCKLTVIDPIISDEILALSDERIKILRREYQNGDIPKNSIVFCATGNPETDNLIKEECEEKNALLNVADVPELCNFIMPATIKRGDLTISVSSQGKAPFFVRETRRRLSDLFSDETAFVVELAHILRQKMIESGVYYDQVQREKIINAFFSMNLDKIIKEEGKQRAEFLVLGLVDESE